MKVKLLAVSLLVVAGWAGSLWSEGWLPPSMIVYCFG